jgi:indolepyruvate ferredoxin oxidoreductase
VKQVEEKVAPGQTAISEAVARYLFKLMAYKDEYEVARLHLETAARARLTQEFGDKAKVYWRLHPPLLRALGMKRKLKLGSWFTPGMKALRGLRRLRGRAIDPFGRSAVRRAERELIAEYERWLREACDRLSAANYDTVAALAALPDMVRGYEQIKLDNVTRYRDEARRLLTKIGIDPDRRT